MGITISNFFTNLFGKKPLRISMFGLDAAGKTTAIYKLKIGEIVATIPTIGVNVETIVHKNVSLIVWDVGAGGGKLRPLWRHYYKDSSAVILVVDSTDQERLGEVVEIAWDLLTSDELQDAVMLVLANKQDLPGAMTVEELTNKLPFNKFSNRKWHIHPTCATKGVGLNEALDWLTTELTK